MDDLIAYCRTVVSTLSRDAFQGEEGSHSYLSWMIDTVKSEPNWPIDKQVRWLGFVSGARDFSTYGPNSASIARMISGESTVFSSLQPDHEEIVLAGIREVIQGLADMKAVSADQGASILIEAALRERTATKASFCLGYLQAYLSGSKIISVTAERDRTRPIFHRIYEQCGMAVPKSKSRDS